MSTILNSAPDATQPLQDWLTWLDTIHPVSIDMGLERVASVADRLGLRPARIPLILVGGTNGKGSTVALLSAIYQQAGFRVGAYTSPHIEHFCERIRINGQMAAESDVVEALVVIEQARMPESLTYFEYTTLAAMQIFNTMQCDVLLFEVGLGGRLDATNIWDADCSIVTSIALDHEEYLGSDVSVIATEKAAIGRAEKPFINGEVDPPTSLYDYAHEHAFRLVDVGALPDAQLPATNLHGEHQKRNAGCAVAAVHALQPRLPVAQEAIDNALLCASIEGRFQCVKIDGISVILDVAHNPAGAIALANTWKSRYATQSCAMVFATMADKDIAGIVRALSPIVDTWHCLSLDFDRAACPSDLRDIIKDQVPTAPVLEHKDAGTALAAALEDARASGGLVLVAGSFYTLGAISASGYKLMPYTATCGNLQ